MKQNWQKELHNNFGSRKYFVALSFPASLVLHRCCTIQHHTIFSLPTIRKKNMWAKSPVNYNYFLSKHSLCKAWQIFLHYSFHYLTLSLIIFHLIGYSSWCTYIVEHTRPIVDEGVQVLATKAKKHHYFSLKPYL